VSDKITSKNLLVKLLETDDTAFAIADKSQKIVWYNLAFKKKFKNLDLDRKKLTSIFKNLSPDEIDKAKNNPFLVQTKKNKTAEISKIKFDSKDFIFKIKLSDKENIKNLRPVLLDQQQVQFVKELHNILTLLIKESSLQKLSGEILTKCISLSNSSFGIIVYNNKKENKKHTFTLIDNGKTLDNFDELGAEIETNLSFLNKWLNSYRRSLIGRNQPEYLASGLTQLLKADEIILSPCIFENNHIATIITGRTKNNYTDFEINTIEQFAALLSFTITSIKTRELNTALETRLLQSQKLETIGKLSSGMAHDFSNLLSSIFGSVNLLRKRVPENEGVIKLIDNIENCSIRARDLTKGLLSFGKPTPRRKELIKPNILLNEISKVVIQTFPKTLNFKPFIQDDLFEILGNGTEIYQVLLNLCVNAKEAIEKTGTITFSGKNIIVDKKNNIEHPLLKPGKYVWFSVKDSGSGIEEENLLKIFDPYFSTKTKDTGSGLGLYVTYGIIKAHNGEVEVSSKPNKGTTFDVFIPSYEPTKIKIPEEEKIILLAEDEVMLSDLLSELLESTGYNVLKVYNGTEVLKVLTEELKVDMVILDYNMPEMNGVDCAKKIRKLNLEMPIILSTGSMSISDNHDLKKIGISAFVTKPYEFDQLLETIQKLL